MKINSFFLILSLTAATLLFSGCPQQHEHLDIKAVWQRVNPDDVHLLEDEMIEFTEDTVYYFGEFGGPNDMMPEKEHGHHDLYPVFKGTYVVDETVEPHTVDFMWEHYWPGEEEDEDFVPFSQLGIYEMLVDQHGEHAHVLLYINFGDDMARPDVWDGEIKFEKISDAHDHDDEDAHDHDDEDAHDHDDEHDHEHEDDHNHE